MALTELQLAALPVGTTNAEALARNAADLDRILNGSGTVENRAGDEILSIAEAMLRLGFEPPVVFTTGLSITRATQTVTNGGNTYHADPADLPFTTTGTFDAAQWILISNVTTGQLAVSSSGSDGAGLIGAWDFNSGASWTTVRGFISILRGVLSGTPNAALPTSWATPAGVLAQAANSGTTGGSGTAYTLAPSTAITSYTANQTFWVKFHASSGAAPTLAISGVASPPNLVRRNAAGALVNIGASEIPANHYSRVTVLSSSQALVEDMPPAETFGKIESVNATVASSALTCTVNPTKLDFRSATLASGTVNTRSLSSAVNCVVPNGATLGATSGVETRIAILLIDNAGTLEAAVVNAEGPLKLDESLLISTTALSTSSDSADVIYSTTARTNVPFRIVGFCDTYHSGGAWGFTPTLIQGAGGVSLLPLMMHAKGAAPMYACRAWVNFNGTGTVAIRAAGNVSSITDSGVGNFVANLSVPMPDANYAAVANYSVDNLAAGSQNDGQAKCYSHATSSVAIFVTDGGTNARDPLHCSLTVFR